MVSYYGCSALVTVAAAQRIISPRIQLHLLGNLGDDGKGFVGGVFLISFGVGELGFPGYVTTSAMVEDPMGICLK
jgi:hypothetical protein